MDNTDIQILIDNVEDMSCCSDSFKVEIVTALDVLSDALHLLESLRYEYKGVHIDRFLERVKKIR